MQEVPDHAFLPAGFVMSGMTATPASMMKSTVRSSALHTLVSNLTIWTYD